MFNVRCPSCGQIAQSPPHLAGARVRCPACDQFFEVPSPHAASEAGGAVLEGEPIPVNLRAGRSQEEAEMDMTPMIDVTFLLLIFFMVTAAFSLQRSFELPVPQENLPSTQATLQDYENNPEYVVVRIDRYNTFYVIHTTWEDEQEAPSEQELFVKVREASQGRGGKGANKMLIVAHREALHQRTIMAFDAASAAGIERVQRVRTDEDE